MRVAGSAAILILLLTIWPGGAEAAGMSRADHAAAMAELAGTRAAMAEARAALGVEADRAAAAIRAGDLAARLDASRAMMRAAVRGDRTAIPFARLTPARQRARCVVMAAGLIDEPLQDLWTVWSMKARGLPGTEDFPFAAEGADGLGKQPGCR
ncbi:MAG: hypothetical protein Q7V31_03515 [Parvibaculum sp.]|uniref:hypothetical protein n=1 Tax=Parvibaculum sp. TaxID=2024848 RepID=UPI002724CB26|nr:hypothetical protein [Parvibaculum sp.]MDO8837970.1 hypothetical protein [Parvibaculum sp.]